MTEHARHVQVKQQIKRGSKVKQALAALFLAASGAFVRARRIIDGVALQYARKPRPLLALVWACLVAAVMYPIHR